MIFPSLNHFDFIELLASAAVAAEVNNHENCMVTHVRKWQKGSLECAQC